MIVYEKFYNHKNKDKKYTKRLRSTTLEHRIDKLHSSLRSAMGFCVKVAECNPFETPIIELQNDAEYLFQELETLLDEWVDTTKEACAVCGDNHENGVPLSCQTGEGK